MNFFKKLNKKQKNEVTTSKDAAKERLHLVLMQDRANVSADFLELMKQEIIEVIKKYIDVDESAIDVRLTNKENEDGTNGAPALYANIPIVNIKNEAQKEETKKDIIEQEKQQEEKAEELETLIKNEENENQPQEIEKKETNAEDNNSNKLETKLQQEEKIETEEKSQQLNTEKIENTENLS